MKSEKTELQESLKEATDARKESERKVRTGLSSSSPLTVSNSERPQRARA
jgi:hypothetical protein